MQSVDYKTCFLCQETSSGCEGRILCVRSQVHVVTAACFYVNMSHTQQKPHKDNGQASGKSLRDFSFIFLTVCSSMDLASRNPVVSLIHYSLILNEYIRICTCKYENIISHQKQIVLNLIQKTQELIFPKCRFSVLLCFQPEMSVTRKLVNTLLNVLNIWILLTVTLSTDFFPALFCLAYMVFLNTV